MISTRRSLLLAAPALLLPRKALSQVASTGAGRVAAAPTFSTPTFVDVGVFSQVTAATVTPALPASRVNGNLLVAVGRVAGATPATVVVSGGWTIFLGINQGVARPMALAYAYVTGSEAAPVFSGVFEVWQAQVFQYASVKASSPIGATSSNSQTSGSATVTCPAITSTRNNSLALYTAFSNVGATGIPSGWNSETNTSTSVADLSLLTIGSSSGATSVAIVTANYTVAIVEVFGQ